MPSQDEHKGTNNSKANSDMMTTLRQKQRSTFSGSKSRFSKRTRQEMEAESVQFNPIRFLALSLKERVAERELQKNASKKASNLSMAHF